MDFMKARPVVMIFTFICIAAGLFLGGLFTGKVLDQTENAIYIYANSTKSDFNCSAVKDEYQDCIDGVAPLRKFCQDFVDKNCSEISSCKMHCLDKYGEDLKICPCQVQSNVEITEICNLNLRITAGRGVYVQSLIASMIIKTKQRFLQQSHSQPLKFKLRNF